jgi:hypothetical protein
VDDYGKDRKNDNEANHHPVYFSPFNPAIFSSAGCFAAIT